MTDTKLKRALMTLVIMSAVGGASAQSSVTLFGVVDATVNWGRGGGPTGTHRVQVTNSGYSSSRVGFRGTEELGGGVSASFWLEAGMSNDDGQGAATNSNNQASGAGAAAAGRQGLTFNRRSTVSLAGGWGEMRIGRDYTPQFWNMNVFDPFGTVGVGASQVLTAVNTVSLSAVRASNSIGYFLPGNLGGVYGQVMGYLGENASNSGPTRRDGSGSGIRVGYAQGPFNVAAVTAYTRYAAGRHRTSSIGGQWDFGIARVMGMIERDSFAVNDGRGWLIGALVPVGVGQIRASYSRYETDVPVVTDPRSTRLALGYVHNLSKRTALYGTYARVRNAGGAAVALGNVTTSPNNSSSGLDLGIRHSF